MPAVPPNITYAVASNGSKDTGFPVPPPMPIGDWTYDWCIYARNCAVQAMMAIINAGGVLEYHVGSRGLKRYTLADIQAVIQFWSNAAADAALGTYSAIQCRRAVPCDA